MARGFRCGEQSTIDMLRSSSCPGFREPAGFDGKFLSVAGGGGGWGIRAMMKVSLFLISKCCQVGVCIVKQLNVSRHAG